jgi:hypothetical protein
MAEVILVSEEQVFLNGVGYTAQVVGQQAGHLWEGWIEFASEDGLDVRRTPRETTQPNRQALNYWATGLSGTYLEGALARTLPPAVPRRREVLAAPFFDAPAPSAPTDIPTNDQAVLDPFAVAAKGEDLLRQELGALHDFHLRNIVRAYRLADEDDVDLEALTQTELIELIVGAVQTV